MAYTYVKDKLIIRNESGDEDIIIEAFDEAGGTAIMQIGNNYARMSLGEHLQGGGQIELYPATNIGNATALKIRSKTLVASPAAGNVEYDGIDLYLTNDALSRSKIFTAPTLTAGSVLFSDGTTLAQDNSNFYWDDTNNRLGIGTNSPTARLHLPVGSTSASSAPLKFATGGTLMTSPEVHAIEVTNDHIYYTINTGTARKEITLANATIGSNELVFGSGAGRITSSGKMVFDDTDGILTVSGGASSTNYVFSFDQPSASGNGIYFSLNSASSTKVAMRMVDSSLNQIFNLTTDGALTLRGNLKWAVNATYTIGTSSGNKPNSAYIADISNKGVVFGDSNNKLTVDATNFVWDDSNDRLGIKTSSPTSNLHVVGTTTLNGTTTVGNGTNATINLGNASVVAGAFTGGLDFNFVANGGIRFIVQGSDGPGFQAFGGTYATYGGQIYFDFGSVARSLTNRAVFFRDLEAGGATILKIDGTGITLSAVNITTDTSTGMKIGTGTTQLLGFWNTTPIAQPTTGILAASFTANSSAIADDTATWDGYTIGQVVYALRTMGLLA